MSFQRALIEKPICQRNQNIKGYVELKKRTAFLMSASINQNWWRNQQRAQIGARKTYLL